MTGRRLDAALLLALLLIALLRSLVWISAYPILKIADETSHFDNIQYRAEHGGKRAARNTESIDKVIGSSASTELRRAWAATQFYWRGTFLRGRLAVPEEKELRERALTPKDALGSGQDTTIEYPGFYYSVALVPYKMFRRASVLTRLYAVRCLSALWGLVLVACTFIAVRWCCDDRALAFAAGLFATLQPIAAQQTIAINNDAALIGLCAIVFVLQLAIVRRLPARPSPWLTAALGLATACAVETKPHAYALVPGSLLIAAAIVLGAPRSRPRWIALLAGVVAYATVRLIFPLLFDRLDLAVAHGHALPTPTHGITTAPLSGFLSFLDDADPPNAEFLFISAWGTFCWLDIGLRASAFDSLRMLAPLFWLGAAAAVVRRLLAPAQRFFWDLRLVAFATLTAVSGFAFVLYAEYTVRVTMNVTHAVQGRALLAVLPALAVVGTTAMGSLVPTRLRRLMAALCVACMVMLAASALLTIVEYEYAG